MELIESKCIRCGKCCYLRIGESGMVVNSGIKCIYLLDNNLCKVYDNRPSWCLSAQQMKDLGVLPQGCGYLGGE